jgi:hypothetical protein
VKIVKSITLSDAQTQLTGVTGPSDWRTRLRLIIGDDGTVFLPLEAGMTFGFMLGNLADHMVAYPAYTAYEGTRIRNIFDETAGVLDPNDLPSNGGMMESGEEGSRYKYSSIDGFKEAHNQMRPFTATDGFTDGQSGATELLIYRRTNPDVTVAVMQGLTAKGATTRGASRGLVIGAGETVGDGREKTSLDYLRDATDPIVRIKIISRQQAVEMLIGAGLAAPDDWTCGIW